MTLNNIMEATGLNSTFKIQQFSKERSLGRKKKVLTNEQQNFISENHSSLTEPEMARHLKISRFYVQKYKRECGIIKYHGNGRHKKVKAIVRQGYFNVMAKENWMV